MIENLASLALLVGFVIGIGTWVFFKRRRRDRLAPVSGEESTAALKTRFVEKRQSILKALSADRGTIAQSRLQIQHVMTPRPVVVRPDMPVADLAEFMRRREQRHSLVCTDDRRLLGIVSDRDVGAKAGNHAADVMTPDPLFVTPDSLLSAAVSLMLNRQISCLPVVDKERRVCGVVTTTDMMMTLQCMLKLSDPSGAASSEVDPATGEQAGAVAGCVSLSDRQPADLSVGASQL